MLDLSPVHPLIIGHRGSSAMAPENTMAAFVRAIEDGADGMEFDVRLARDGVPVIIHDATLRRTGRVSSSIADLTATELAQIDVGSWFNDKYPAIAREEFVQETVPGLKQLFDLTAGTAHLLYLEMKSDGDQVEPLAAAVVQMIRKYSFANRVIVESFNLAALHQVKRIDAGIRTAALFEPRVGHPTSLIRRIKTLELAFRAGADEIALHHSLVSKRVTAAAAKSGLPVIVWTVDTAVWLDRALSLGIHALITNNPAKMLALRRQS
jgi:glycerophosphoryl diester phosphodiesterase